MIKTIKTRNSGTWTEARWRSFIVSMLRKNTNRWGPRNNVKKSARWHKKITNANGRLVYHSICAKCHKKVPETTSSVDHILPVVDPYTGFVDWNTYMERLFCEEEGFQVLCNPCHTKKTKGERLVATRRKQRERL